MIRKGKLVAVVVALTMVLSLVGATSASALTAQEMLQLLIAAGVIAPDKAAAATAALNAVSAPVTSSFATDLTIGSKGADVTSLQQILVAGGYLTMPSGVAYGYFGSLTKAAVIKFQLAKGISPAAGYVGPKTRAVLNASATTPVVVVPSGTDLVVSLAATSPSASAIIAGQAAANLAEFTFKNNSASPAVVTNVTLARGGVSADTSLSNVYLFNGAVRLTDAATVSSGKITFNAGAGIFTVAPGSSITVAVKSDIASGAAAGQNMSVSLTGVTASVPVSASLPISGATMTVASASDMAQVTLASTTVSTSVQAGTLGQTIWGSSFSLSGRAVLLKSLAVKVIGSVPADSLQNIKLFVSGIQVATASGVDANGMVTFDLTAAPYRIDSNRSLEIRADVVNGSNRTFSVSLQNKADISIVDTNYNVGISVLGTLPTTNTITISAGTLSVSLDTTLSSGNVVYGSTGVTLARYTVKAFGENMKVSYLNVASTQDLSNVTLYANGSSISSSQNVASTSATLFSLGSSLNVTAGQTVTLEVRGDLKNSAGTNTATSSTVYVTLSSYPNNTQGSYSSSLTLYPSAAISGPTMTVVGGALSVSKNSAYSNTTLTANTNGVKLGSFILSSNSSEAVRVTGLTVGLGGTLSTQNLSNLRISEVSSSVNPQVSNNFGANFEIPANGSKTVDVYADVGSLSSNTSIRGATSTITLGGYFDAGDIATTTLNGSLFTAGSFIASTTPAVMAQRLANEINSSSTAPVSASVSSAVITLTAKTTVANYATTYGNAVTVTVGETGHGTNTLATAGTGTLGDGASITTTGSTIVTTLTVTATGALSNVDASSAAVTGQTLTVGTGSLATPTLLASSPSARYVIGGTTGSAIATFNFKASVGAATIKELSFVMNPAASPAITKITVGGVTKDVALNATTTVSGLNISVPVSNVGTDVPVTVAYNTVGNNGIESATTTASLNATQLTLGTVKFQSGNTETTNNISVSSNKMLPVAGMPTIDIVDSSSALVNGSVEVAKLAFTVTGSAVRIREIPIKLSFGSTATTTDVQIYDGNTEVGSTTVAMAANGTGTIVLNDGGFILSSAKTFRLLATVTGVNTGVGTDSITTQLGTAANFKWDDVEGGTPGIGATGSQIPSYSTTDSSVISN